MKTQLPATIHELTNSEAWDYFIADRLGNDLFLSDPDRAERIHKAAEDGADGSTHQEVIEDWRDCVEQIREAAQGEADWAESDEEGARLEQVVAIWHERIIAEIDACENWHEANGSLHEQIG